PLIGLSSVPKSFADARICLTRCAPQALTDPINIRLNQKTIIFMSAQSISIPFALTMNCTIASKRQKNDMSNSRLFNCLGTLVQERYQRCGHLTPSFTDSYTLFCRFVGGVGGRGLPAEVPIPIFPDSGAKAGDHC